jgi:hypothetical protein
VTVQERYERLVHRLRQRNFASKPELADGEVFVKQVIRDRVRSPGSHRLRRRPRRGG